MSYRYLYNAGVLGVPTVFFDLYSRSYPLNYIAMVGAVTASELIILLIYCTSLCQVKVEETIEGIEGFKLTAKNTKTKSLLGQCELKKTCEYLNSKKAGLRNVLSEQESLRKSKSESSGFCSNFSSYPVIEFQDDLNKRAAKEMGKGISNEDKNDSKVGESFDPWSLSQISNLDEAAVRKLGINESIQASSKYVAMYNKLEQVGESPKLQTIEEEDG